MTRNEMRVWIIERDNQPYAPEGDDGQLFSFAESNEGTAEMRSFLDRFYRAQPEFYWDAVLYERISPGGKP